MRSVALFFFLIISFCDRFGSAQEQTNLEKRENKPTFANTNNNNNNKGKGSIGEREYYIPSYSSSKLLQRPQEFIYPNNFRNAYQYSQYKYTNRVPDIVNHRQWSSSPTLGNVIQRSYRYSKSPNIETNVDSVNSGYKSDSTNDLEYQRPENVNLIADNNSYNNKNENLKSRATDSGLKNRVRDFDEEQGRLTKQEVLTNSGNEYKDQNNNNDNKMSAFLFSPVMRRKSASNDNLMRSSALQSSEQRSIPIPMARQQNDNSLDHQNGSLGDIYFVAIVACVSAVAIFGVFGAGYCVYKVQQSNKAAADVDYPAYGVVGPASKETNSTGNLSPSGDRKLAQSAQMYHYHHQKQQMIASEKAVTTRRNSASDVESDEENEEGEYTVYECPGLAPTGEMEVKNPLFHDDITPVSSPAVNGNTKDK